MGRCKERVLIRGRIAERSTPGFFKFFANQAVSLRWTWSVLMLGLLISCASVGPVTVSPLRDTSAGAIRLIAGDTSLRIAHAGSDRAYMTLPLDKPFLTAAMAKETVSYRMASFRFKEGSRAESTRQRIDAIASEGDAIVIKGVLAGEHITTGYELTIRQQAPLAVSVSVTLQNPAVNRVKLICGSDRDEQFFGFGTQYSHFNLKGKKLFVFTEEQGVGRGDQPITFLADMTNGAGGSEFTSYAPIPHYITSSNRSVFFENTSHATFDLTREDEVSVEFKENQIEATIWLGSSPLDLIEKYTQKTGRFPRLPKWAHGTWLGLQGGAEKVRSIVKEAKAAGNPVTAVWIQDWVGRRTTRFGDQLKWRWYAQETSESVDRWGRPEPSYPAFRKFCAEMNADGVKVLGYINPFLADTDPAVKDDPFTNPMLAEAKAKGYLVKNAQGADYLIETAGFPAYLIDVTNPGAVQWVKHIIQTNMIDQGLSGWMADFGEWLPCDAVLFDHRDPALYHNVYPVDWARINREAIREAGKEGEIVFFTRAGFSYSNKYSTAFWLGDQMAAFGKNDGLPSAIVGLNSAGVSGIAVNHSDVGGYTGIKAIPAWLSPYDRGREITQRWAEANAFTAILRTHEGNVPGRFHQVYSDAASVEHFALMGKIHYALKDYIAFLSQEASEKGYPIVRHPFLNFPADPNTYHLKHQFMLGADLLVLPVVEKGAVSVEGYFPEGAWKHVLTGDIVDGGQFRRVRAPIGQPAAYVNVGGAWSDRIFASIQNALQ